MAARRDWLLGRFPWARSRSTVDCAAAECNQSSDCASESLLTERDPHLMDVLREVIALRQAGDVQASLALVDRSLAEGMSSNYLLDNRARALAQLNRENEAIQIWEVLSECGDLELQETSKRLVYLQRTSDYLKQGNASEALLVLEQACVEGLENDVLLDNRARVLVQLNRHIEAILIWRKLYQFNPKRYESILARQLVGALQVICRSQGWNAQYFNQDFETLDALERGVLKECELLRRRGYAQLLIQLVDKALETGFESPWLVIAKANALIELEKFVDAQNLLNHFKDSVHEQHALAAMEQMLDALSGDVEVELVVRAADRFKAKGDLDAAQDLLVKALLQDHSCVVYEETLQQLLIERGEKNPTLQAFELFLGEAEKMQTAALISGQ